MCIYFTVLFTVYKCHFVNMLCSPLAEENKVSIYLAPQCGALSIEYMRKQSVSNEASNQK